MTKTLSITKAREELTIIGDRAKRFLEKFIVTVNGSPSFIIMSYDEYQSMQETSEILADKKLMRDIKTAEEELRDGKGIPWEKVKKELKLNV